MKTKWLIVAPLALAGAAAVGNTTSWSNELNKIPSYFRALTKQVNENEFKLGQYNKQAEESYADYRTEASVAERTIRAYEDYSPVDVNGSAKGQLSNPCYQTSVLSAATNVQNSTQANAINYANMVYATDNTTGDTVKTSFWKLGQRTVALNVPLGEQVKDRETVHRERYCTLSEAQAGYCSLQGNGMQGADQDFSALFLPGKTLSGEELRAAQYFTANVAPVKLPALSGECGSNANCVADHTAIRADEAALSMVRASMIGLTESRTSQNKNEFVERP